jgi:hypothetical protein
VCPGIALIHADFDDLTVSLCPLRASAYQPGCSTVAVNPSKQPRMAKLLIANDDPLVGRVCTLLPTPHILALIICVSCLELHLIALAVVSECYQLNSGEGGLGVAGCFAKQMWQMIGGPPNRGGEVPR